MSENFFFWTGFSTLLVHEMDAVRLKEWRILPLLSRLDDRRGFAVFTLVHIPIYILLFVGLSSEIAATLLFITLQSRKVEAVQDR